MVSAGNAEALARIADSKPELVDLAPAGELIPDLPDDVLLHAGPPLAATAPLCGALRGAILGTLIHEGRAANARDAESLLNDGLISLRSAADFGVLATYGGVLSRRTRVFAVENAAAGTRAYSAINEGRGLALRYGSHDQETLERYGWLEGEFADVLQQAIRAAGRVALFPVISQALQMGDDGHSRQKAASSIFANLIAPWIAETCGQVISAARSIRFLAANEIFFLPLTMAAAKATMRAVEGIADSSLVTAMAANGHEWGIQISSRPRQWFTAPVPFIEGRYFEGYSQADASPVIGDSEIAETLGLGAFAMSGAPALARYMGGTVQTMRSMALEMYRISAGESEVFKIPELEYRGTPTGIDVFRIVKEQLAPIFNTGIAHRLPGIGQIGAGFGRVPMACCLQAAESLR
jgi:hypothetical protein